MYLPVKDIEDGLRRVCVNWRRCPSEGGRLLLGPLRRAGGFRAVSLSVTAPHEGHAIVAVLVDAVGKTVCCFFPLLLAFD